MIDVAQSDLNVMSFSVVIPFIKALGPKPVWSTVSSTPSQHGVETEGQTPRESRPVLNTMLRTPVVDLPLFFGALMCNADRRVSGPHRAPVCSGYVTVPRTVGASRRQAALLSRPWTSGTWSLMSVQSNQKVTCPPPPRCGHGSPLPGVRPSLGRKLELLGSPAPGPTPA